MVTDIFEIRVASGKFVKQLFHISLRLQLLVEHKERHLLQGYTKGYYMGAQRELLRVEALLRGLRLLDVLEN